jgi:hypothetical protein
LAFAKKGIEANVEGSADIHHWLLPETRQAHPNTQVTGNPNCQDLSDLLPASLEYAIVLPEDHCILELAPSKMRINPFAYSSQFFHCIGMQDPPPAIGRWKV